jgi:hypothetical protein
MTRLLHRLSVVVARSIGFATIAAAAHSPAY